MVNIQHVTLVADTERIFTLDANYGEVRITMWANPSVLAFNTGNVAITSVASTIPDGNQVLPAVLCSRVVKDLTSGSVSVVRVRAQGTPSITVEGVV